MRHRKERGKEKMVQKVGKTQGARTQSLALCYPEHPPGGTPESQAGIVTVILFQDQSPLSLQ